jgi:hypothetical protein
MFSKDSPNEPRECAGGPTGKGMAPLFKDRSTLKGSWIQTGTPS